MSKRHSKFQQPSQKGASPFMREAVRSISSYDRLRAKGLGFEAHHKQNGGDYGRHVNKYAGKRGPKPKRPKHRQREAKDARTERLSRPEPLR